MAASRSTLDATVPVRPPLIAARRSGGEASRSTFPNSRGRLRARDVRPDRQLRAREGRGSHQHRSARFPARSEPVQAGLSGDCWADTGDARHDSAERPGNNDNGEHDGDGA
jgi:hypothetical protein